MQASQAKEGYTMKIVTDSAADLTVQEARDLDINVAPLYIQFPEGEVEASEISPDSFYDRLEAMSPKIPTTAQPSAGVFQQIYEKLGGLGEDILSIHISSGLSGTIQSARLGASHLSHVVVDFVDTLTLSGGQRFQVLAAARAAQAGHNKEFILSRLAKIREATEVVYTLETLEYLRHGGRIGRVQALAGMLLHIKPIIRVDHADGKYSTVGKERTIRGSLESMIKHLGKIYPANVPLWVSVLHGRFENQANQFSEMIQNKFNVKQLEILRISPVLGVHTGPGIVGVAIVPYELMDGLD
jgi:DegV family protein with EDD domain